MKGWVDKMQRGCKSCFTGCLSVFIVLFLFFVGACVRINSEGAMIKDLKKIGIAIKRRTIDLEAFYMIGSGPDEVTYMWLYPPVKNRSKYISPEWKIRVFVSSLGYMLSGRELLEYGYKGYVVTDLIFNKEKGNDFRGMEKVLGEYSKEYNVYASSYIENYGYLKRLYNEKEGPSQYFVENGELVFKQVDLTYEEFWEKEEENQNKFSKIYDEYFKEVRQFETMNWDEYAETFSYFPILYVVLKCKDCDLTNKEEIEKEVYEKIKKYHNPKSYELRVRVKKENG
ncbi:hypothetical protein [Streptobacillus felis]|nr:hypothetical protein [Streptobacillus felis]